MPKAKAKQGRIIKSDVGKGNNILFSKWSESNGYIFILYELKLLEISEKIESNKFRLEFLLRLILVQKYDQKLPLFINIKQ